MGDSELGFQGPVLQLFVNKTVSNAKLSNAELTQADIKYHSRARKSQHESYNTSGRWWYVSIYIFLFFYYFF